MTKKLKFTLIALLLAVISCLGIVSAFAKYMTTNNIGDGYFNLSIKASRQSFAVYSASDNSLNFYYGVAPTGNETTTVYKADDFLNASEPPWAEHASYIQSVTVVDEGIQPTLTKYWFAGFENCTSFELSRLDTSKVTEMGYMFQDCSAVEHLDLSRFNTSSVSDVGFMDRECMYEMFAGCSNLQTLDISNFNTKNILSIYYMFLDCENLTTIYAGAGFVVEHFWRDDTFENCVKLEGGSNSKLKDTGITSNAARIDGLKGGLGLFTGIVHPKIDATLALEGTNWNFSTVEGKTDFAPNTQSYIMLSENVPSTVMITSSDASVDSQILTVDSDGVITIPAEFMIKYQSFTIGEAPRQPLIVKNDVDLTDATNNHPGEKFIIDSTGSTDSDGSPVKFNDTIRANDREVTINSAVLRPTNANAASVQSNGSIVINDAVVHAQAVVSVAEGCEATINGGLYNIINAIAYGNTLFGTTNGTVYITGGTFYGNNFDFNNNSGWMTLQNVKISGGTFAVNPTEFVEPGYKIVENTGTTTRTWTVVPEGHDNHSFDTWTPIYKDIYENKYHLGSCADCNQTIIEEHIFENGACSKCGETQNTGVNVEMSVHDEPLLNQEETLTSAIQDGLLTITALQDSASFDLSVDGETEGYYTTFGNGLASVTAETNDLSDFYVDLVDGSGGAVDLYDRLNVDVLNEPFVYEAYRITMDNPDNPISYV